MNFSTSAGSNLKGLRPGPIFTAGRYGFRLPDACCTTHEMLTPSFRGNVRSLDELPSRRHLGYGNR